MDRCVGCESAHHVTQVAGLPWCGLCVTDGLAAEYEFRVGPNLCAAVDAELARRHIPTQRRWSLVKAALR